MNIIPILTLFISTFIFTNLLLRFIKSNLVYDKNKKLSRSKLILYSSLVSLILCVISFSLSYAVDISLKHKNKK